MPCDHRVAGYGPDSGGVSLRGGGCHIPEANR